MNTYSGGNAIKAQDGNATSGSEDRLIPIVMTARYYLINVTMLNLDDHLLQEQETTHLNISFGPGNYSTGLPITDCIHLKKTSTHSLRNKMVVCSTLVSTHKVTCILVQKNQRYHW